MPTRKKIQAPPRIFKRRGGFRACGNGYTSNNGCGESMRHVVETLRAYGQEAGIKVCTEPPDEEQSPQDVEGYDTETPNMGDLTMAGALGGGYYESASDLRYYAAFEGEAKSMREKEFVDPENLRLQRSKSDATEMCLIRAKQKGIKVGAVVTLSPEGSGGMLRVKDVEFIPIS